MAVNVEVILWKYSSKKDGTFPVKLRVTVNTVAHYCPINYNAHKLSLTEWEWNEIDSGKPRGELKRTKEWVNAEEVRAREIVNKITVNGRKPFSFSRFKDEFDCLSRSSSFFDLFDRKLGDLLAEERIGTYDSYSTARKAFWAFVGKEIDAIDITPRLLKEFEGYLVRERSAARNTIAIYMRALRVIYNLAMEQASYLVETYPFATKKNDRTRYQIKTAKGKKGDALTLEQLTTFAQVKLEEGSTLWEARLLWFFSYYCQGMNFKDMLLLRPQDFKGKAIVYVRHKTKNTELIEEPIFVPISESIVELLERLGCNLSDPEKYVFPFLEKSMDAKKREAVTHQTIKSTNKRLRKICEASDLPPITTYYARHTFATMLKRAGFDTSLIKDCLGHSSTAVTESYIASHDIQARKEANDVVQRMVKVS